MSNLPAIPEPSTTPVPALLDACAAIVAWARGCDDVAEVREAHRRMKAIAAYLESQDHARTARTAMIQIEVRIGELLGPAVNGGDRRSDQLPREVTDLPPNRAHEFRKMAAHPDVVEQVIAESTEKAPASRSKVLEAIRDLELAAREAVDKRAAHDAWAASFQKPSPEVVAEGHRRGGIHGQVMGLIDAVNELTKTTPDDVDWALTSGLDYVAATLRAEAVEAMQSLNPYRKVLS